MTMGKYRRVGAKPGEKFQGKGDNQERGGETGVSASKKRDGGSGVRSVVQDQWDIRQWRKKGRRADYQEENTGEKEKSGLSPLSDNIGCLSSSRRAKAKGSRGGKPRD